MCFRTSFDVMPQVDGAQNEGIKKEGVGCHIPRYDLRKVSKEVKN